MEEIKVAENAEEMKAKDYTTALERMQSALKREKQMQLIKQMNEKNKSNVSYLCYSVVSKLVTVCESLKKLKSISCTSHLAERQTKCNWPITISSATKRFQWSY